MPEIKKQFTGGKMNKDLDERLVPNGEYRDAMNIQVSTSEGSHVGAVQNILGNKRLDEAGCNTSYLPTNAFTVGSVSDEKNDAFYWLVSGYASDSVANFSNWGGVNTIADYIVRYGSAKFSQNLTAPVPGCDPVFVDKYAFSTPTTSTANSNFLTGIPIDIVSELGAGWSVAGVTPNGGTSPSSAILYSSITSVGFPVDYGFSQQASTSSLYLSDVGSQGSANGGGFMIPMLSLFSGGWAVQSTNVVYVSSQVNTTGMLGAEITILPGPTPLLPANTTITAITSTTLTVPASFGGQIISVKKLDLSNNLLGGVIANQNSSAVSQLSSGNAIYSHSSSGVNIDGVIKVITSTSASNGMLQFNISDLDTSSLAIGDLVTLNGVQGCIGEIYPYYTPFSPGPGQKPVPNNSIVIYECGTQNIIYPLHAGTGPGQLDSGDVIFNDNITIELETPLDLSSGLFTSLFFKGPRTLNFEHNQLITGINIVDDMLFWTDNATEPKKINITRSIQGTSPSGDQHTKLVNTSQGYGGWYVPSAKTPIPAREEHITVIKKAPDNPPTITPETSIRQDGVDGLAENVTFADVTTGLMLSQGDTTTITISSTVSAAPPPIIIGDILFLKSTNTLNLLPPEDYEVRARVIAVTVSGASVIVDVTLVSISPLTPLIASDFRVAVSEEGYDLFSRKFPRFAYRYKYEDGEYSSIGPYSDVVFLPGDFRYHPTEAYNKGMVNNLKSLTLKDFVPTNIPEDVVQVDLLFRDETSSKIYAVKNIPATDAIWTREGSFPGSFGSYEVSTENIYANLPTNQGLRPWDNVPRLSLGQEVAGSRLIYANYLQGYDLEVSPSITASVEIRNLADGGFVGQRSVKSLRTYDVGIVYGDKYGRETPVFTNKEASIILPKANADLASAIKAEVDTQHPSWAKYYKFFVKETSNEYYNLALGRTYDAEDGNIWLAFPSVDRNKVDEDTYLILKKGVDKNEVVSEKARYKIVAIENEAPDYIKTIYTTIAKPVSWPGVGTDSVFGGAGLGNTNKAPTPGAVSFYIDYNRWVGDTSNTNEFGMPDLLEQYQEIGSDELFVNFVRTINGAAVKSKYYLVTNVVVRDTNNPAVGTSQKVYEVFVSKPFLSSESWIGEIGVDAKARPVFYKSVIKNKPEFDGRFFVKIENDPTATASLTPVVVEDTDWRVTASAPLYYLRDKLAKDWALNIGTTVGPTVPGVGGTTTGRNTTAGENGWTEMLKFGGDEILGRWFIDQVSFCGWHRGGTGITSAVTDNDMVDLDSNQTYLKSNGDSTNSSYGTGKSRGNHFQNGIASWSDASVVEGAGSSGPNNVGIKRIMTLSYSGINPSLTVDATATTINETKNWKVGDDENSYEAQEKEFVSQIKPGSKFRMAATPELTYTIWKVETEYLYNHRANLPSPYHGSYRYHGNQDWSKQNWVADNTDRINKRAAWHIHYTIDSDIIADDLKTNTAITGITNAFTTSNLQFIEEYDQDRVEPISQFPAIFETEPKEDVDLDIYYEASGKIPTSLKDGDGSQLVPIGSTMNIPPSVTASFEDGVTVAGWGSPDMNGNYKDNIVLISPRISYAEYLLLAPLNPLTDIIFSFKTPFGGVSYVKFVNVIYELGTGSPPTLEVTGFEVEAISKVGLSWFNCWSFGNGVESNRIGDTYNKPYLTNGATASTTLDKKYGEEKRSYGLIYSGLYNSVSGVNDLNQFIAAEKITKDINPIHGSIQKLFARDSDLLALCEDKCLKILVQKDALFNADGNSQLLAREGVLGQAVPFSGEYGISKNPESFASESYRAYFTDKVRGSVMRLSMDGLTSISDHGMKDYFRDNLKLSNKLIGSYDDRKSEYNITIEDIQKTVSFREDVRGWVSFKSFVAENAISCANEYYTFVKGKPWRHHVESVNRNTFHEQGFTNSSLTVLMNDVPGSIKSFKTVNYEGSQTKVSRSLDANGFIVEDGEYFNLFPMDGWFVESAFTDLEKGGVNNFIEKEGKWFGFINGDNVVSNFSGTTTSSFDTEDFSIQGIGMVSGGVAIIEVYGCMNPIAFNFNPNATIDNNSCVLPVYGCTDPIAQNYNSGADTDDGSCIYPGCTDSAAINYDPTATVDDGSCIATIYGCTDSTAFNYYAGANVNQVSAVDTSDPCEAYSYGCMNALASNYSLAYNTPCTDTGGGNGGTAPGDNNICCVIPVVTVLGCTDGTGGGNSIYNSSYGVNVWPWNGGAQTQMPGQNYDPSANTDDGSCQYCSDPLADNYDGATDPYTTDCIFCTSPADMAVTAGATTTTEIGLNYSWHTLNTNGIGYYFGAGYTVSMTVTETSSGTQVYSGPQPGVTEVGANASFIQNNLLPGTEYTFEFTYNCNNTTSNTVVTINASTLDISGCTDNDGLNASGFYPNQTHGACNYDPTATVDDGSCNFTSCEGCMDTAADNFDGTALFDDGSCTYTVIGCMDDTQLTTTCGGVTYYQFSNYNPLATVTGICIAEVEGCTANCSSNYDPAATIDDDCCLPGPCPGISHTITSSGSIDVKYNLWAFGSPSCYPNSNTGSAGSFTPTWGNVFLEVKNDQGAVISNSNYAPGSTTGVQLFTTLISNSAVLGRKAWVSLTNSGLLNAQGSTFITIDLTAASIDGNCTITEPTATYTMGCEDPTATNQGSYDITDNTQCTYPPIIGCTDDTPGIGGNTYWASNYDPTANEACTDMLGTNQTGVLGTDDNVCCDYVGVPSVNFNPQNTPNVGGRMNQIYFKQNGAAYQTAEFFGPVYVNEPLHGDLNGATSFNTAMHVLGDTADTLYATILAGQVPLSTTNGLTIDSGNSTHMPNKQCLFINPSPGSTCDINGYGAGLDEAGDLFLRYTVRFSAVLNNNISRNNLIEYDAVVGISSNDLTLHEKYTVGCKYDPNGIYGTSFDATVDLHSPSYCIIPPVTGCTDNGTQLNGAGVVNNLHPASPGGSINYNSLANVDDDPSCCTHCKDVARLTINTSPPNYAASGNFVTQFEFNFAEVCEAESFTLQVKAGTAANWEDLSLILPTGNGNTIQSQIHVVNFTAALPGGSYAAAANNGSGLELNLEHRFRLRANCTDSSVSTNWTATVNWNGVA